MDIAEIYDYILFKINEDLTPYGFKRSGKSALFYRYSSDKKVGCAIAMQKSMFNSPESYSFTFNLGCVALHDLSDYYDEKLTLAVIKQAINNYFIGGMRLGHLCRGHDYWWEIDDEILQNITLEEYYSTFLHPDIIKGADILDEQMCKKERVYNKSE